jgi:hypothetical protein
LLTRCLHDEDLPLDVRAAGALGLLYGRTLTDIVKLTAADLHYIDEETYLRFAAGSVPLPPPWPSCSPELRQSGTPAWPCTTSAHRHDCCSPGASPAARHPRSP